MKTLKLILIAFFATCSLAKAQEIVATGGDFFINGSGSVSVTIGEPVTETFSGSEIILTQGFQQNRLKVLAIDETDLTETEISVYPNPVHDYLKVRTGQCKNELFSYRLYDFSGKFLTQESFQAPGTDIPFCSFSPSVYFIRIYAGEKELKAFKIIKQ